MSLVAESNTTVIDHVAIDDTESNAKIQIKIDHTCMPPVLYHWVTHKAGSLYLGRSVTGRVFVGSLALNVSRRFIHNCILSAASGNLLQRLAKQDSVFDSILFDVRIHIHMPGIFLDMLFKSAYVCECVLRSSKQIKLYVSFEAEIMNNMYTVYVI